MIEPARHPSQLYEAGSRASSFSRYSGSHSGARRRGTSRASSSASSRAGYGLARFTVEFFREPDPQFRGTLFGEWGFHMGQFLTLPMIAGGIFLIVTAAGRRHRIEPIAGTESVA